ncbi:MAG: CDP-archaeol synthase [Gammaproteobacteria bacterium]|nr:CDP-archaeol synthase [Gammaproteobacteria bacterium]
MANGAPIVARKLLPDIGACPLDMGSRFIDGKPLFGSSKTVRGIIASLFFTAALAPVFGLPVSTGITLALGAMLGDLLSSFIKRRLNIESSEMAMGLDQVPESLIPLLFIQSQFSLGIDAIILIVILFFLLGIILSRVFFKLGL